MSLSGSDERAALLRELQSLSDNPTAKALDQLLVASQVALLFGVCERTVRIWANKRQIPAIYTPSGRWKFSAREIMYVYKAGLQPLRE